MLRHLGAPAGPPGGNLQTAAVTQRLDRRSPDRRSQPCATPPLLNSTPRQEPSSPVEVTTCAVRSTARAGLKTGGPSRCAIPADEAGPAARLRRAVPAEDRRSQPCARLNEERRKTHGSELVRCPRVWGESVKGGTPPFTKGNDQSELAEARGSARGSFDCGAKRRSDARKGPGRIRESGMFHTHFSAGPLPGIALVVGTAGFEPTTTCTPSKCATRLRHVPTGRAGF